MSIKFLSSSFSIKRLIFYLSSEVGKYPVSKYFMHMHDSAQFHVTFRKDTVVSLKGKFIIIRMSLFNEPHVFFNKESFSCAFVSGNSGQLRTVRGASVMGISTKEGCGLWRITYLK